jgi:hypothetical protein
MIDNRTYENIEFLILDYNSSDGLEEYIRNNYQEQLENKKLVYFKIDSVQFYDWTHSRNLAVSLSTGEIVCNLDADNFTGPSFAQYLNDTFNKASDIFLTTYYIPLRKNDVLGRICMLKKHFLEIGGYDERMKHYGFEDIDLLHRLIRMGLRKMDISNPLFLNAIQHSNQERISNSKEGFNLKHFFIRYITPYSSELLFVFHDKTTKRGTMINNLLSDKFDNNISPGAPSVYDFSILEDSWSSGTWPCTETTEMHHYHRFYKIESKHLTEQALFFFHQVSNRLIMEDNNRRAVYKVQNTNARKGNVFKNFSTFPLELP